MTEAKRTGIQTENTSRKRDRVGIIMMLIHFVFLVASIILVIRIVGIQLFYRPDPAYENADSLLLLTRVVSLLKKQGYKVGNIDATVLAQAPKLAPYIQEMRKNIANACKMPFDCVSVKATTEEGLGFTGSKEGIAAHAVCLLEKENQIRFI